MPPLETACLKQKAVLWMADADKFDTYGEHKVTASKVELKVRWEEGNTEAIDPQGNVISVDAKVVVDRQIRIGSIMWEGCLKDVAATPVDLYEVVTRNSVPDLKNRHTRRVVGLRRYSNELPATTT